MRSHIDKDPDSDLEINRNVYWATRCLCNLLMPFFAVHTIVGMENIPRREPAVLASKHTYWFDLVTTGCVIDRTIYTFAKSSYFDTTTLVKRARRWWMKKMGAFRVNGNRDQIGIKRSDIDLILRPTRQGDLLLIYPEGTRVQGRVGNFDKGLAATVRVQEEVNGGDKLPIIPLSPAYSTKPFSSLKSCIPLYNRVKIALVIGKPIYYNGEMTREFTNIIREKITECYNRAQSMVCAPEPSLAAASGFPAALFMNRGFQW